MQRPQQKQKKQPFLAAQRGSGLIEVLIAAGVVGLILTALASALTYSIKTQAEAKYRALATQRAQEAMEVFRREKAVNSWDTFKNLGNNDYCLNTLPAVVDNNPDTIDFISGGDCTTPNNGYNLDLGVGQNFKRTASTVFNVVNNSLLVTVTVFWNPATETAGRQQVTLSQTFYQWD